jgi:predicted dehydrogenase
MSNNVEVLIVGAGTMAGEYCKVLNALGYTPTVIGRGEDSAKKFESERNISVVSGGVDKGISLLNHIPKYGIVAVNVEQLAHCTMVLLEHGVKNILVEKPAAMNRKELEQVTNLAIEKNANVYVAYNRHFYASTEKARQIIKEDGGVTSFNFEFTEWGHVIEKLPNSRELNEEWFLSNSTHVVDLAFFLGGTPKEMSCYIAGKLDWHSRASVYSGAGVSETGALFSYQANWAAPGRWSVEVLTRKHRLYFKPMEQLQIQEIGSINVNQVEIDDELDRLYKPGLYKQTKVFLELDEDDRKLTVFEQLNHMKYYEQMELR